MFIDGDVGGSAKRMFRLTSMTAAAIRTTFPAAILPAGMQDEAADRRIDIVEAVWPTGEGFGYRAFLAEAEGVAAEAPLATGRFEQSPFITFRWLKGAGEVYGRSPVMTALPDIKTANKVVELVLKNASIAVTGIWLADDDGVLNPANIKLTPGSIIPKAPGSAGLTPLQAPGRFDVSELVLSDLRARIRHTLLVDRLAPIDGPRMTATEVAERSSQTGRLLGAVYGRLQSELLNPLLGRAVAILRRRGEIPDLALDGRAAELQWRSPLARAQAREDVSNTLLWLEQGRPARPRGQGGDRPAGRGALAGTDAGRARRAGPRGRGAPRGPRRRPAAAPEPGGRQCPLSRPHPAGRGAMPKSQRDLPPSRMPASPASLRHQGDWSWPICAASFSIAAFRPAPATPSCATSRGNAASSPG